MLTARRPCGPCRHQPVPNAAVGVAGEQLVTVDQVEECAGLAAERVYDVAVVHDMQGAMGRAPALERPPSGQRQDDGAAEQAFEPVVVEADPQPVADQARWHGVEHATEQEPAVAADGHEGFVVVCGAPGGQGLQEGALDLDQLAAACVGAADDLVDEAAVVGQVVEVAGAAQQQGLGEGCLKVAVGCLDRAVLMGDAAVVAGRLHGVVGAQRLVAPGLVVGDRGFEVAERGRQAVAAMLAGCAADGP